MGLHWGPLFERWGGIWVGGGKSGAGGKDPRHPRTHDSRPVCSLTTQQDNGSNKVQFIVLTASKMKYTQNYNMKKKRAPGHNNRVTSFPA